MYQAALLFASSKYPVRITKHGCYTGQTDEFVHSPLNILTQMCFSISKKPQFLFLVKTEQGIDFDYHLKDYKSNVFPWEEKVFRFVLKHERASTACLTL